jgi:acetyltransferase-like isoleucine patch superfamily enzyme
MIKAVYCSVGLLLFAASALAVDNDQSKVLGSVHIDAGARTGDATTVNGSVEIGANAVVKHVESVNGGITMHDHATADSTQTVNGATRLETGARVKSSVELVNGSISLAKGADVGGHLSNVNGSIQLDEAHVGGGIETTQGDIDIGSNSRVEGGILVNKANDGWFNFNGPKPPRVVIGPGSVVKGTLKFNREVKLYVSDRATIGTVQGATVNKFTGDSP